MPVSASFRLQPSPDLLAWIMLRLKPWIHFVTFTQRRLFLFLLAAFLFHLGLLGFIRIDTTREHRHRLTRPVAILASSGNDRSTHPLKTDDWDRLSDPRLFLIPHEPLRSSPSPNFLATFSTSSPSDKSSDLLPMTDSTATSFLHPPLESEQERLKKTLNPSRVSFLYQVPSLRMNAQPTWQWNESLRLRSPVLAATLPSPVSNTPLLPTRLRLCLAASGTVIYVLLEQSSGKPELDQEAIMAARKIRFQALAQPLSGMKTASPTNNFTWGLATLSWYSTPELEEPVVPTP